MRARRLIAMVCAAVAVALAVAPPALAGPPPIVRPPGYAELSPEERGRQLFAANCAHCHGSNGEGVPPGTDAEAASRVFGAGPPLIGVGALSADFYLTTGYMPLGDARDQPVRTTPRLTSEEISVLTDYVASLGDGPDVPSPDPAEGDVARGYEAFATQCAGCHQVVGEGGVVTGARVPPLDRATPRQVWEAVRIGPYVMPRFPEEAISDEELLNIVAYVEYIQDPRDEGGWGLNHIGPFPEGIVTWFVAGFVLVVTCMFIGSRLKA